jgi:hypothetical protein
MTLPFKYVNQLERGKWTPLEEKWLKKIKQTLRQAETNPIRSIQLVRCLGDMNWIVYFGSQLQRRIHFSRANLCIRLTWKNPCVMSVLLKLMRSLARSYG